MREETTTKDTKKNHLVTLSFVLFVPCVVDSRSCLNLCNLRNLWFLVLLFLTPGCGRHPALSHLWFLVLFLSMALPIARHGCRGQ